MKPLVDEVFEYIVRGELHRLDDVLRPEDALHIRAVVSTEDKMAAGVGVDLDAIVKAAPWITPLFVGPKIYCVSASTAIQGAITGGQSNVLIDWSFSFDSNVAEKVRAYVNGEDINQADRDRVISLLKLKRKYDLKTDLLPFLFENLRLSRGNEKNERPLKTIEAFKKIEFIDWNKFDINPEKPVFRCVPDNLIDDAKKTYEDLVSDSEVIKREHKALLTQVIIFELAIIWLGKPKTPEDGLSKLIEFCVLQLGKLPKYELRFAWMFLSNPNGVRFFGPLSGVKKDLPKALKGMAWDISHMRTLETMSTLSSLGSFFMPIFVSFDDRFADILKSSQIQFLVVDDRLRRFHSATVDEFSFQEKMNACMSKGVWEKMGHIQSELRRNYDIPALHLGHILENQTLLLERLASEERVARGGQQRS